MSNCEYVTYSDVFVPFSGRGICYYIYEVPGTHLHDVTTPHLTDESCLRAAFRLFRRSWHMVAPSTG